MNLLMLWRPREAATKAPAKATKVKVAAKEKLLKTMRAPMLVSCSPLM